MRRSLQSILTPTFKVTDAPWPSQFGQVVRSAAALPALEVPFSWLPPLIYKTQQQWSERLQPLPSTPTIALLARSSMMPDFAAAAGGPPCYQPYADSIGSMPHPKYTLHYGAYGAQYIYTAIQGSPSEALEYQTESSNWQLEQELCDN